MMAAAVGGFVDEGGDSRGGEFFVEGVVDEGDGGGVAGAEALELHEGELAVFGGLAHVDAQLGLAGVGDGLVVADFAGDRAADGDDGLALGHGALCAGLLEPELFVEAGGVPDVRRLDGQEGGDLFESLPGERARYLLDCPKEREECALLDLVAREDLAREMVFDLGGEIGLSAASDLRVSRGLGDPGHEVRLRTKAVNRSGQA